MTLKELELFYYLCENPHISKLAIKIGMSQSAISLSIKSLENKLKEKLFERVGKRLILNERGRYFKNLTKQHYIFLKEAKDTFLSDKVSGILKISSSKTIGNYILNHNIFKFLSSYEDVNIENEINNSAKIVEKVLSGEIDIGFIESSCSKREIIKHKFGKDVLVVVSSDESLSKNEYFIDELYGKKWLFRESGSGTKEIFLDILGDVAKDIKVFMQYNEFEELKSILLNYKESITCISKFVVEKELKNSELFEIKIRNFNFERDFYVIWHKNRTKSRLFREFLRFNDIIPD